MSGRAPGRLPARVRGAGLSARDFVGAAPGLVPVAIVDGFARGPDGAALDPFARFAERVISGGALEGDDGVVGDGAG